MYDLLILKKTKFLLGYFGNIFSVKRIGAIESEDLNTFLPELN